MNARQPKLGLRPRIDVNVADITVTARPARPEAVSHSTKKAVGWRYQRQSEQGKVIETQTLTPNNFTYEIGEYSRWEVFLGRYLEIAEETLPALFSHADIKSVILDYFDRFIFEGDPNQASPECLLASPFFNLLADSARSGREAWHLHRGWFEGNDLTRFLVNQNLDIQHGKKEQNGETVSSLAIMTRVENQNIDGNIDLKAHSQHLGEMHHVSVEALRMVLHDDMKIRIGLN